MNKFNQHDIVVLTKAITRKGEYQFPAGSIGTIVHQHAGDKAFEVEFLGNILATVKTDAMRPEYTCVYCGCTDSRACPGGCTWVETHEHTPTGVCSQCTASIKGLQRLDIGQFILIKPGGRGKGKLWLEYKLGHEGMDTDETKLADHIEKFFNKEF